MLVSEDIKYLYESFTFSVPPKDPVIVDESGIEASATIGPYAEGSTVEVSCEVSGGKRNI